MFNCVVWAAAFTFVAALAAPLDAAERFIIVQSTTSTQNSGLFEIILPEFQKASGVEARVVAVGTGQALKNAANCDGDVVVVHAQAAEEQFVAAGYGVNRRDLMFNDFVIVGPGADPAGIVGAPDTVTALIRIAEASQPFASRGDDSGTHKKELALWRGANRDPAPSGDAWYRETGSGMGATLNIAVGMNAYALTDRATWLAFENKVDHVVLHERDEALFNQYGIILVNPEHCPNTRLESGQTFVDWMLSAAGQNAIAAYTVAGEQLFFPNAAKAK
ncbi:MAG: substrate-binding domain-containing protein [Pseudomonadota bacterium]